MFASSMVSSTHGESRHRIALLVRNRNKLKSLDHQEGLSVRELIICADESGCISLVSASSTEHIRLSSIVSTREDQ